MKKILTIILVCTMILTIVAGCNRGNEEPKPDDKGGNEDIVVDEESEVEEDNQEMEEVIEKGNFVGQIDNNFIEVETENGHRSLMITDESRSIIEDMEENTSVEVRYYRNENNQLVLTGIDILEEDKIKAQSVTGIYVGQIDNTSIEVTVDDEPKVFMNYEMSQLLEGIEEGDKVEIHYIEEESGQLMIQSIEKVE